MGIQLNIKNDVAKLHKVLGSALYSDPMCFITEVVSNAKDSHTRAGVKEFINVLIEKEQERYWFIVRDRGTGLTKQEFIDRVCTILNSDKEGIENEIGNKGLGKIAFSAYGQKRCFYKCRKDGKETIATMYEQEDEGIQYDIISEEDTEEANGVEFKTEIAGNSYAIHEFKQKMFQKLAYFGDIHYSILGSIANNDFSIHRNELYQTSSLCSEQNMHMTIDDVFYPINWSKLGIGPFPFPIAVRFHLADKIEVSTTREAVIYNDMLKTLLVDRIEQIMVALAEKASEKNEKGKDIIYFIEKRNYNQKVVIGNKNIALNEIDQFVPGTRKIKKPFIEGVSTPIIDRFLANNPSHIFHNFGSIKHQKFSLYSGYYNWNDISGDSHVFVLCTEAPRKKRADYYKYLHPYKYIYFVGETKRTVYQFKIELGLTKAQIKNEYFKTGRNLLREQITEWCILENQIKQRFIKDEQMEYSKEFLDSRKREKTPKDGLAKEKGDITLNVARPFLVNASSMNPCKYEPIVQKLEEAYKSKLLTVYGKNSEIKKLNNVFEMMSHSRYHRFYISNKIRIAIVSDREYKKIPKIHNFMNVEEYIKGNNQVFRRAVTCSVIQGLIDNNRHVFNNSDMINEDLSQIYAEKLKKLNEYAKKELIAYMSDRFMSECVNLVSENNYWDWNIYQDYLDVKKEIHKLQFLKVFQSVERSNTEYSNEVKQVFKDLCKYYKFKMNWENYGRKSEERDTEATK